MPGRGGEVRMVDLGDAAVMAREKPVEQGRAGAPDVQGAGRAGCETNSNGRLGAHRGISSLCEASEVRCKRPL